ncbi:ead/Ea22-like family protein [Salmonella enterica]|nr:ead/Ea22-like family protein [Salmonella enterica]EAZ3130676.1 ead/Ea22-like family protein [Salmonella enterica]HAF4830248.1 ead/Ea22-like family protein [Salmonella enterica]
MSNIDKQALREEFQCMQDHYSDPADRDRQIIYIAAEALLDELEKAQRANVAQDDHINQQQDRIEQLEKGHKEAAKQINSWRRLAKQNIAERGKDISELEAARQRIAELESKNGYLRTIAHEQNELAIRASLDSNNATVEMGRLHKRIAELEAREIKPAKGEVLVVVSGFTGCGKSAIAGEIEIAMKAIGVPVQWTNGDAEKHMTGADWLTAIEMYKPTVRIVEVNVPRATDIKVKE